MSGSGVNVILVNVYQKCEGVNVVENKERVAMIQKVAERVRMKGEMLIVGGDFNDHIWELNGVENVNERMLKKCAIDNDLEIMNVTLNGMQECTRESGDRSYHLDYIIINNRCREKGKDSWVGGLEDVVESDHRAVGMRVEWVGETRKRVRPKKKRVVPEDKWEEFGRKVDEEIRQGKWVQESMCLVATELAEASLDVDGDGEITRGELEKVWCKIKRGMTVDESGVLRISEGFNGKIKGKETVLEGKISIAVQSGVTKAFIVEEPLERYCSLKLPVFLKEDEVERVEDRSDVINLSSSKAF
ncbi:hypothetical protein CAPTEDRAFT_202077 [Capitella teleta]|uniref:Endonuclease/exonuclease/phosphatase domain-containing protein n=1 Tax=Capitella teleta TaxID=283909 RepID=R7T5S2_CAPTE|nr:hypothetical protein CAPTEDRAFT_202077 [Capitella teleta]|eukprot:ELT88729.1 hypothetical protein CAPTEDRAFT_202077 [Capitella teleta]